MVGESCGDVGQRGRREQRVGRALGAHQRGELLQRGGRARRRGRQPREEVHQLVHRPAVVPGQLQPEPADGVDAGRVEPEVPREPLLDEAELLVEPARDLLLVQRGEVTDQVGPAPLEQVVLGLLVPLLDDRARPVVHVGGVGRGEPLPQRAARSG